jgi:hypothetical protein
MVPELRFGILTGDPADAMFTPQAFQGASTAQINTAKGLYSLLTGRVTQILGNARLNEDTGQYEYLGNGFQRGQMRQWGFYVQDNWRVKDNLTINAGLRYELQQPFVSLNNSYSTATLADICGVSGLGADGQCNLFKPGTLTGQKPKYVNYAKGTEAFKTDRNNFAPSLGMTWRPNFGQGALHKMMGNDGDTVFFGSYAMAYERAGMADFSDVFGDNPGVSLALNRNATLGNITNDGKGIPAAVPRHVASRPPGVQHHAVLPDHAAADRHDSYFQQRPAGALRADVGGRRPPQAVEGHRHRSALRRHAPSAGVGLLRHQRDRHHLERLRAGVPQGAGQPAGEHRGRPGGPRLCLYRAAGHLAAADLPRLLQRAARVTRRRHGRLHLHQLHEHQLHQPARDLQPGAVYAGRDRRDDRTRRRSGPQAERAERRSAGELLPRQPRRRQRAHRGQHRLPEVRLGAVRHHQAPVARVPHAGRLRLRQALHLVALLAARAAQEHAADRRRRRQSGESRSTWPRPTGSTNCRSAAAAGSAATPPAGWIA